MLHLRIDNTQDCCNLYGHVTCCFRLISVESLLRSEYVFQLYAEISWEERLRKGLFLCRQVGRKTLTHSIRIDIRSSLDKYCIFTATVKYW